MLQSMKNKDPVAIRNILVDFEDLVPESKLDSSTEKELNQARRLLQTLENGKEYKDM